MKREEYIIMDFKNKKCLIAYFSHRGNNYVSGKIIDLTVGNTEVVANMICDLAEGELFHIEGVNAYPKDYTKTTEVAKKELQGNERPQLKQHIENLTSYDVVFLGYPNWWGTMPMPVFSFLEENDFAGKIIIPFCTHEGSGLGNSEKDISKLCPEAILLNGLAINGSRVKEAKNNITNWLSRLE